MPNTSINFSTASGNVVAANQTLNGTGTPGATVSIWNGNVQVANTTVGANGTWSAPVTLNVGVQVRLSSACTGSVVTGSANAVEPPQS